MQYNRKLYCICQVIEMSHVDPGTRVGGQRPIRETMARYDCAMVILSASHHLQYRSLRSSSALHLARAASSSITATEPAELNDAS